MTNFRIRIQLAVLQRLQTAADDGIYSSAWRLYFTFKTGEGVNL